ncbi:MAG: hypothetical protein R8K50_04430 [Mariprofundus sp.]
MNADKKIPTWQNCSDEQARFSRRMAAQMRLIERYRYQQFFATGHLLSRDQAAAEWIARFSADFPQSFSA